MKYSTTAEFQIFWNNERPFFKDRRVRQAFFFSSRRRHTSSLRDWSSDVCSSDLPDRLRAALSAAPRIHVPDPEHATAGRSEERRVGKECRSRWAPYHEKKKKK